MLANEKDTAQFVHVAGLKRAFDLSYRNHRMDEVARTELRGRLIFLFRLLKVDTVLPEHFAAGLKPHSVSEKYYFARRPQLVNRLVDIGPTLSAKIDAIRSCKTMVEHMMKDLNDSLADRKLRLPEMNANEFIRAAFVARDQANGAKRGLEYAEEFHYIGPDQTLNEYIRRNAVPA